MSFYPDDKEQAAITAAYRAERFTDINPESALLDLLVEYIHENANLENYGLRYIYREIKRRIVRDNLFHLLLVGFYNMRDSDIFLYEYEPEYEDSFYLTLSSVTQILMNDYFKNTRERERLTESTPNFELYYEEYYETDEEYYSD